MKRLPVAAFVALAIATVGAFFLVQTLKVSTPFISGVPAPHPADIDPVSGGTCAIPSGKLHKLKATSFRRMTISFLLLNKADDVTVQMVDGAGHVVDTLARAVPMSINHRRGFVWNGHLADGRLAPSGRYYVQVTLIHQKRTIRITSQNTGQLEPVTVEDSPAPIKVVSVRAGAGQPAVFPQADGRSVSIRFTVVGTRQPTVRVYRTDVPGTPRLVDTFHATTLRTAFWNGTTSAGTPAPQGTYLISVSARDRACSVSRFPVRLPAPAGSTPHAGVTVRYLAAQPPMTAVKAGSTATVAVDSRRHRYGWTLRRVGASGVLSSGHSAKVGLRLKIPAGGLYTLSLRWGSHRTAVPIVAGATGAGSGSSSGVGHRRILVVLPALTWQGENPVDDDGDGTPNLLTTGGPIQIERPFTAGLPAGYGSEAGLIAYLHRRRLRFTLTTDLSLISSGASMLSHYSGLLLAGSERWLPAATGSAISTWVEQGGHVLSFGIDALQRTVTVSGGEASDPSGPHSVDFLLARPGAIQATGGSLLLVQRNGQGLFPGGVQELTGFRRFQTFGPVQAPARLLTSVGVSAQSPAVIGYRLGRGAVLDVGLPGFGKVVAHDVTAQDLLGHAWKFLQR
ncbi:MAG TPA: N,N-dimethylformamidase beta subunit family domain-containing protein [Solirubrobacteraceae bacterium]|nr:N,N-dimethylformamidase beta subunit family domain-containing protein [Solirubrobacteraceae bacterium]